MGLQTGKVRSYTFEAVTAVGVQARFELPPCGSLLLFLAKRLPSGSRTAVKETDFQVGAATPAQVRRLQPNVLGARLRRYQRGG